MRIVDFQQRRVASSSTEEIMHNRRNENRRTKSDRRGTVVVEFAIVAPVFFLFIIASFEFARLNVIRHTADNAAYEAARHAMVPGATSAEAVDKANSILNIVGTRGARVTIDPTTLGPNDDTVTVTVEVPLAQNGWIAPHFTSATTLRSVSTMLTERAE
jgi:Flp pilus assembly protein TadG